MIGLDTNVLARYLAGDPANDAQVQQAISTIDTTLGNGGVFYINLVVLSETYWVLNRHYAVPRREIATAFTHLLDHEGFKVEASAVVRHALKISAIETADFADCLIAGLNYNESCTHTLSFDKKAVKKLGFKSP